MPPLLICFDYDGVLVDSFDQLLGVCQQAQLETGAGRSPVAGDFRSVKKLTFDGLAQHLGIPDHLLDDYKASVILRLDNEPAPPLFRGISKLIAELGQKHWLAVVSANSALRVSRHLAHTGIDRCFQRVVGGDTPGEKADKIKMLMDEYGIFGNRCLMIGDTIGDLHAGSQAGCATVAVTWGFQSRRFLSTAGPTWLADRPDELLEAIDSHVAIT